ncbi:DnaJ sub B member 14 [Phlyctochytrium planicorne]|nr:DnaJ sub B member 14 [Phlyctochytrium planicorne]
MNADEAQRCLDISKAKFADGNSEAAVKFARKSLALCETDEGRSWLEFVQKNSSLKDQGSSSSSASAARKDASKPTAPKAQPTPAEAPARPYTPEQVEGIKKIKAMKGKGDLYGVLGLEKGCEESEIKKAYRKLALQYHPDKCGAPGTDEAFKAIGHSFAVLSDHVKRENYDKFGIDGESGRSPTSSAGFNAGHGFGRHGGFGEEISPEELFNMFFGDLQGNALYSPDESLNERSFSWEHSRSYSLPRETSKHSVRYFVNPRMFEKSYKGMDRKLKRFEDQIESQFRQNLYLRCIHEREYKANLIHNAKSWFSVDEKRLKEAQGYRMMSCERLDEWDTVK